MFMQTGIIAFRRDVLLAVNAMAPSTLEAVESVDMNRVVESGGKVRMVLGSGVSIGVDTPEELIQAEALLAADPICRRYLTL